MVIQSQTSDLCKCFQIFITVLNIIVYFVGVMYVFYDDVQLGISCMSLSFVILLTILVYDEYYYRSIVDVCDNDDSDENDNTESLIV